MLNAGLSAEVFGGLSFSPPAPEVKRIRSLRDQELLLATKSLVEREREITMLVLRHLEEIERRKLYSDLKYSSLYDYCMRELRYSDGATMRRISAMRLLREIPQLEEKIESGRLTLSNISQAQSFFRNVQKAEPDQRPMRIEEKLEVLAQLENKSSREGLKTLLEIAPPGVSTLMVEKAFNPEDLELRCPVNDELRESLKEVLALLGPKGSQMKFSELLQEMANATIEQLKQKRFGKRRVAAATASVGSETSVSHVFENSTSGAREAVRRARSAAPSSQTSSPDDQLAPVTQLVAAQVPRSSLTSGAGGESLGRRTRYIPQAVKHAVWQQANGQCVSCGSKHHLQYDHIEPHALGGSADFANIQLLCASCNLRRGVKTFGAQAMRR